MILEKFYDENKSIVEVGVDEVGRGPMFGRIYTAAVILPKNDSFEHSKMKDSKKFTSWKKLLETADYIKNNCLAYSISYEDEESIDKNNILNATHLAMHSAIKQLFNNYNIDSCNNYLILVDGNNFKQLTYFDKKNRSFLSYRWIRLYL